MSYILSVILSLSLINTIFLVNNLKTNSENKKQLDNLYNFTIHNIELTNNKINTTTIEAINCNIKDETHDEVDEVDEVDDVKDKNNLDNSIINNTELTNSITSGFSQWSFLNLGRTLKQKSTKSTLYVSKIE